MTTRAPRRRGRKRRLPRPERERQMLEVAGRLFAGGGYAATSMDEIAAGVGVSKPMLYAYFGSKQGLYAAYIRQAAEGLFARLLASVPAELPAERRLLLGLDAFLMFVDEHRDGWSVLFQHATTEEGPLGGEVAERRRRLSQIASHLLAEVAAGRGESTTAGRTDALGHALVGAAESLANWWLEHPELPRETVLQALTDLTCLGIQA